MQLQGAADCSNFMNPDGTMNRGQDVKRGSFNQAPLEMYNAKMTRQWSSAQQATDLTKLHYETGQTDHKCHVPQAKNDRPVP
uniref:SCP domain-containing protein n=1 Tax=Ascaris lumbricoides TaxID=6252 RepID=A0A0M3HSS7_ASCLU